MKATTDKRNLAAMAGIDAPDALTARAERIAMTTETVSDERLAELIEAIDEHYQSCITMFGNPPIYLPERQVTELARDYAAALRELQSLRAEVEALRRDAATRMVRAIGHLIQLPCACPYDPGRLGEGAQLMGPICRRCAAIHLLNGGELPDAAKGGDRG